MPLHAHHPVFMRLVLDGLDHPVRRNRGNAQTVPKISDGLMMRRVYLHIESIRVLLNAAAGCQLSQFATRIDNRGMNWIRRIRRKPLFAMLNLRAQFAGNILVQRAAQTNIKTLATIANREDRLSRGESVLDDPEIGFFAIRIGFVGLCVDWRVIQGGVDVRRGSGKYESVQVADFCRKSGLRQAQRNRYGRASCRFDSLEIIPKLGGDALAFLHGRAPGNSDPRAQGNTFRCCSGGHRTLNRSIREGDAATRPAFAVTSVGRMRNAAKPRPARIPGDESS